jgi:acyl carrier protein
MSVRDDLVRAIEESGATLPADLDDEAPLISSGILDSTALFELALWIEDRVAPGLDLTTFDLAEEWDTIAKVLAFVERHRKGRV